MHSRICDCFCIISVMATLAGSSAVDDDTITGSAAANNNVDTGSAVDDDDMALEGELDDVMDLDPSLDNGMPVLLDSDVEAFDQTPEPDPVRAGPPPPGTPRSTAPTESIHGHGRNLTRQDTVDATTCLKMRGNVEKAGSVQHLVAH